MCTYISSWGSFPLTPSYPLTWCQSNRNRPARQHELGSSEAVHINKTVPNRSGNCSNSQLTAASRRQTPGESKCCSSSIEQQLPGEPEENPADLRPSRKRLSSHQGHDVALVQAGVLVWKDWGFFAGGHRGKRCFFFQTPCSLGSFCFRVVGYSTPGDLGRRASPPPPQVSVTLSKSHFLFEDGRRESFRTSRSGNKNPKPRQV